MSTYQFQKIVLAGGSGYLGHALANYFKEQAREIVILTRGIPSRKQLLHVRYVEWDAKTMGDWSYELEGSELVINLTGKSVNCRYTKSNRSAILQSRLDSVNVLGQAIRACKTPPKHFIQLASATIYRHSEDTAMTEANGQIGEGFSVDVCKAWEQVFNELKLPPQTLKTSLRTAIVYGNADGVFVRLRNLVKAGMGGKQGKGKQMISWIHELDFCRMVEWIYMAQLTGVFNVASPKPVRNDAHMKLLATLMRVPIALPQPEWLLSVGAWLIGTETELILKSRYVVPERALNNGFLFKFPDLKSAFKDLV